MVGMFRVTATIALIATASVQGVEEQSKPKLWKPSGKRVHDPWKKFCGATLCYDVLEVSEDANEDAIKKSYRKLAREWHPDKNPEKGAREKFLKIAKAYEVLSTEGERKKYDHLMSHPEEYVKLYGEYYFKIVAPPSDVTFVVLFLLVVMSAIHYMALLQKKDEYNAKLIKLCVENKGPTSGGTVETEAVNQSALKRFTSAKGKPVKSSKSLKDDEGFKATVEAVLAEENLLLLQPTFRDTIGFKILLFPITFATSFLGEKKSE